MPAAVASIGREHVEAFIAPELKRTAPSSAVTRYRPLLGNQQGVRPDGRRNAGRPFGGERSSQRGKSGYPGWCQSPSMKEILRRHNGHS
jgi:hypothetical protein